MREVTLPLYSTPVRYIPVQESWSLSSETVRGLEHLTYKVQQRELAVSAQSEKGIFKELLSMYINT